MKKEVDSMDLNKHLEFFNPQSTKESIHIIGLGALGSNTAEQLVRLGFETFILYDFDVINPHNITNQTYTTEDINTLKIDALTNQMRKINPEVSIEKHPEGWLPGTMITGYLFLCVDSIELRKQILEDNKFNADIKFVTDMRIGLEEAQMYATKWGNPKDQERILSTMQFKDDEVLVPVSACGTQLTVLPTIQMIVSLGVMNFINYLKTEEYNYQSVVNSILGLANSFK
jgi:molybdopterin/thiamine biosynthesis adenylyltransferase